MYEPWINNFDEFKTWINSNLGTRPDGMSLDRSDNDGHYVPGNLKWSTALEQIHNRRPTQPYVMMSRPTNTGEHHISYNKAMDKFIVSGNGWKKQSAKTLSSAIEIRDKLLEQVND